MPILALRSDKGVTASIIAPPGETLAQTIWLSGLVEPRSMCAGLGLCGRCKLRYLSAAPEPTTKDLAFFSRSELDRGWRLGCQHLVPENEPLEEGFLHVEIPLPFRKTGTDCPESMPNAECAFLGLDLGTTTIAWRCAAPGRVLSGEMPNPQAAAGADIISRLQFAREADKRNQLAALVRDAICSVALSCRKQKLDIRRACIAGNSAMTEILLEKDIEGLCSAPGHLSFSGGEILPFPVCGLPVETVFPPLLSPYVGGDASCALLYLLDSRAAAPFLMIDLGTNAELALYQDEDHLFIASLPLGPALEGIGPICGQAAAPGVASSFSLSATGLMPVFLPGMESTGGICGTGYLSLIRILRNLGLVRKDGHFTAQNPAKFPLAEKILAKLDLSGSEKKLCLEHGMSLFESDMEQLLKVRAALVVGIDSLLREASLEAGDIRAWKIAGAAGAHATRQDLEMLGIPVSMTGDKLDIAGNASLEGACLLAENPDKLPLLNELCTKARLVRLTSQPGFADAYLKAMQWP